MIAMPGGFVAGILLAPGKRKRSVASKKLLEGFDDLADKLSELEEKFTP